MKNKPNRLPIPPVIVIVFGILAVSTSSIFIRFAQENAPSLVIAAYRLSLASLILLPVTFRPGQRIVMRSLSGKQIVLALFSGVFLALHFATWISSLAYTTVASSVVLVNTSPLWVALLTPLFLKDRLGKSIVISLLVTMLGGLIVGISDVCQLSGHVLTCPSLPAILDERYFLGDFLALLGAFFASGYLLIGRQLRSGMSLLTYTFLVYGAAAIVLIGVVAAGRFSLTGYPTITYVWFLALAVIPQLLGHSTFNWVLGYLSATFVSISLLGEPIGSTILAYFILGEVPSLIKITGAVLILVGIAFASRFELHRESG